MTSLRSIAQSIEGKQPMKLIQLDDSAVIFEADAVLSENYSKSSSVATYPIEKGNEISEHAAPTGFTINVTGVVSDASMSYFDLTESAASSFIGGFFGNSTKSQAAWDILDKWHRESTPLQVNAKFAKDGFKDRNEEIMPFLIESLSIPRNSSTGSALRYSMTLRAVRLVEIGQASLTTIAFAVDKGSQLLKSNNKSDSTNSQSTWTKLKDDKVEQGNSGNIFSFLQ